MKIHIVQKGDTLWKIADKYNVDFENLKQMNAHLSDPNMIMPGMKIKVPTQSVPVKKEAPKKEAIHPYVDKSEKPMAVMAEKEAPKKEMPMKEMPMPQMPPMPQMIQPQMQVQPKQPQPQIMQPHFSMPEFNHELELDVNNFTFNFPQFPTMQQPVQQPQVAGVSEEVEEEEPEEVAVPPQMPPVMMPQVQAPMYPLPQHCVPVSPVMPGSGLGPCGGGYPMQPMPYMPQMQPMPTAVSPAVDEDLDDNAVPNMPDAAWPAQQMAPQAPMMMPQAPMMQQPMMMPQAPMMQQPMMMPQAPMMQQPMMMPQAPMHPYPPGCSPVGPVMPGSGLPGAMPMYPQAGYPTAVNPAMYDADDDYEMPAGPWVNPQANVAQAGGDCGCESDDDYGMMPQAGAGYGVPGYGVPTMMPGYGMPYAQQPLPYGQYQTQPYPPYGFPLGQGVAPQVPMNFEDDED